MEPPIICRGNSLSPRKMNARIPAKIGSKVAVMLARVERIWFIPEKKRPKGRMVPITEM